MKTAFKRIVMLSLFGVALETGALVAQTPLEGQQILPTHGVVVIAESDGVAGVPQKNRPLQKLFNSHGMGCASNFNQMGCGNTWSELTFIFGSCRTFFGQPCVPNPPHFGAGRGEGQKCCGN